MIKVRNTSGIEFLVRMVHRGEPYGAGDCLIHDRDQPLVEFYDTRYPHTEHGQFVSRYDARTILNIGEFSHPRHVNAALQLDGGVPEWFVDAKGMEYVRAWVFANILDKEVQVFPDHEVGQERWRAGVPGYGMWLGHTPMLAVQAWLLMR